MLAFEKINQLRGSNWLSVIAIVLAILTSASLAFLFTLGADLVAGLEIYLIIGLLGVWPFIYLCFKYYDFFVFLAFGLFGFVQFEPAPVDLLLFSLVAIGLINGRLNVKNLGKTAPVHILIWIFLIVNFISFMIVPVLTLGSLRYTAITIYMIVIFYFLKMYTVSEREMKIIWFGYLTSALLNVFLVYSGFLGITPEGLFVDQTRATGYFKDANVYGPFMLPVIIFLVDEIWHPYFIKRKILLKAALVVILASGLFLSFSRAAWGSLIAALGIYFILQYRHLNIKIISNLLLAGFGFLFGLVVLIISLDLVDFFLWRFDAVQSYDSERFRAQYDGILSGFANIFGLGPGQLDAQFFAPHSLYIRTFGEHGFLGFLAFFGLIAFLLVVVFIQSQVTQNKVLGVSGNVIVAVAIGILLNSFLVDTLHWRHFWFVLGLLWILAGQFFEQRSRFLNREIGYYFARYEP